MASLRHRRIILTVTLASNLWIAVFATGQNASTNEATTQPASIALPEAIGRALTQNAEQLGPSITLAWTQRSSSRFSGEEYAQRFRIDPGFADVIANAQYDCRITWQEGKFIESRVDRLWPTKKQRSTDSATTAFNGEELYGCHLSIPENGDPTEEQASAYLLANLPESMEQASWGYGAILNSLGFRMPYRVPEMRAKTPVRSFVHMMLDDGARLISVEQVLLDGESLVRLRMLQEDPEHLAALKIDLEAYAEKLRSRSTEPEEVQRERVEYKRKKQQQTEWLTQIVWLDPKMNYATRKYECRLGNQLRWRTLYDEFAKVADRELFLPRKVVFEVFVSSTGPQMVFNEPISRITSEVTEIGTEKLDTTAFVPKITTDLAEFEDFRDDPDHPVTNIINSEDGIPPRKP